MAEFKRNHKRLGDRILYALELASEQEDLDVAETLNNALELSLTRNAGGRDFLERRDYPLDVEVALSKLRTLKKAT